MSLYITCPKCDAVIGRFKGKAVLHGEVALQLDRNNTTLIAPTRNINCLKIISVGDPQCENCMEDIEITNESPILTICDYCHKTISTLPFGVFKENPDKEHCVQTRHDTCNECYNQSFVRFNCSSCRKRKTCTLYKGRPK